MTKKIEIAELCKGVHCVDLGESFQTHTHLLSKFGFDTAENEHIVLVKLSFAIKPSAVMCEMLL